MSSLCKKVLNCSRNTSRSWPLKHESCCGSFCLLKCRNHRLHWPSGFTSPTTVFNVPSYLLKHWPVAKSSKRANKGCKLFYEQGADTFITIKNSSQVRKSCETCRRAHTCLPSVFWWKRLNLRDKTDVLQQQQEELNLNAAWLSLSHSSSPPPPQLPLTPADVI